LGEEYFSPERLEFYGQVNFMKAGILYADLINTVSKKYALEIQTPEFGERMDGLFRKRAQDLHGIVNGIDYEELNPATDKFIYENYTAESIERKKENKKALQKEMGLPVSDTPLIGIITRLVDQKGLDLIAAIFEQIMDLGVQFVLLGTGEDHYQRLFAELKMKYPQQTAANIGFNVELAQKIYAGSDIFLMPSRFEPCGLSQMISLRYGTIPLVRSVGGLADTIEDYNPETDIGNGFSFKPYHAQELLNTIARAVGIYRQRRDLWQRLMDRAMKSDFSWERSAKEYVDVYRKAIDKNLASFQNNRAVI
jgi:starch synthase